MKLKTLFCLSAACALTLLLQITAQAETTEAPAELKPVLAAYFTITAELEDDKFEASEKASADMLAAVEAKPDYFGDKLVEAVKAFGEAKDLHAARDALKPVSAQLIALLKEKQIAQGGIHTAFCPMAAAAWLQPDNDKVRNPYFGKSMLECGSFRESY